MRILFLAPQPFFQERGTPIAVRLALEVLAARGADEIDLLVYHEGDDIQIPRTSVHRIWAPCWLKNIGPGISLRKLLCDVIYIFAALRLILRSKRQPYAVVHAVEEAVFIALLIKIVFRIPYLYDMDSSLALQVTEKWLWLKPLQPVLDWLERVAVRNSLAVVPVCDALAAIARNHGSTETHVLNDISLLNRGIDAHHTCDLKGEGEIPTDHLVVLYIGNLERYQGIDLLLESFARIQNEIARATLAIIGGRAHHITNYIHRAQELGISARVRFLGPRSVSTLDHYLRQADVLVSPRVKGNNTPMKIYSYLHSGKAIVATELPTHTQVMDSGVAKLAAPTPEAYSAALLAVLQSEAVRNDLGAAAFQLAEQRYTFKAFSTRLLEIYARVGGQVEALKALKA